MDNNFKALLNALALAVLALLIVNLIAFGVDIAQYGIGENWHFRFKHAVFYLNDRPSGLILGSSKATGLMFVVFIYSLFRSFRMGKLSFN